MIYPKFSKFMPITSFTWLTPRHCMSVKFKINWFKQILLPWVGQLWWQSPQFPEMWWPVEFVFVEHQRPSSSVGHPKYLTDLKMKGNWHSEPFTFPPTVTQSVKIVFRLVWLANKKHYMRLHKIFDIYFLLPVEFSCWDNL